MTIQGEVIGVDYNFAFMGRTYGYASGIDEAYTPYSVGRLLVEVAVREAFHEGMQEYDFLWGAHEYKLRWGSEIREVLVLSWPITPSVFIYRHGYRTARQAWIKLKHLLPAERRARISKMIRERFR